MRFWTIKPIVSLFFTLWILLIPSTGFADNLGAIGYAFVPLAILIGLPFLVIGLILIFHLCQLTFTELPWFAGQDIELRAKKVQFWNTMFTAIVLISVLLLAYVDRRTPFYHWFLAFVLCLPGFWLSSSRLRTPSLSKSGWIWARIWGWGIPILILLLVSAVVYLPPHLK